MRVLIWKDHGIVHVHCAETLDQLAKIQRSLVAIISDVKTEETFMAISMLNLEIDNIKQKYEGQGAAIKKTKIEDVMVNFLNSLSVKPKYFFEIFVFRDVWY